MINTLLEHVPIKLEAPENDDNDEGDDDANDKYKRNVNGKGAQPAKTDTVAAVAMAVGEENEMEVDDEEEDDEDEESEEESETDVLEDEDEVAISSDEEAELEAQRIKLQDLIGKSLLQSGRGGQQVRGRSASSSTTASTSSSSVVVVEQQKTSKQKQLLQQQTQPKLQEQENTTNGTTTAAATAAESAVATQRSRKRTYSTCSVASSLVTPSCQTESCGNIYQFEEFQIYLFNCSFCDELCSDMTSFSRHLQAEHKLFQEDVEEMAIIAQPQRRSARNHAKQTAHASSAAVTVKAELNSLATEDGSHSPTPVPLPPVGSRGSMQSCGNIFVLNHKKLFLICGYCECKYANLELFDRHLRQQHQVFSGPRKEIDVMPKKEVKQEMFVVTEVETTQAGRASVEEVHMGRATTVSSAAVPAQAMVAIPDGMNLNNNDMLTTLLPRQVPETPPPEEEKEEIQREEEVKEKEKIQREEEVKEKEKIQREEEVEEQNVVEEEVKKKVQQADQTQPELLVEEPVQLPLNVPPEKENAKPAEQSDVKEQQTRVTKRKRKRRSFFSRRSPAKRRAAKVAVHTSEEPVAASVASQRPRRKTATLPASKDQRADEPQPASQPEPQHELPSSPESALSTKLVTEQPPVEINSCAESLGDSEVIVPAAPIVAAAAALPAPTLHSCDLCQKAFKKSSRLAEHRRLHTGEKPFRCDECGREFRIKMRLNEHKLRHRKEKAFKCEMCGLCVATKQDLVLHKRHHSGDRRYRCPECPKAFVRSSDLKIHARLHTGEKPYVCDVCQKSFCANQNLIVHRRSHMGEKNYKCDFCDKRFMRNIDRKVHHRTHTGEKPYKCEICQRGYSSRVHVRAHIEREHVGLAERNKPDRKKPGPKPKHLKDELAKQKQIIEELQQQLLQQIMAEDLADDEELLEAKEEKQGQPSGPATPLTPAQKVEDIEIAAQQRSSMQQVSVTVSMQVQENVAEPIEPMPEKENDTVLASSALNQSVKKERKITSYFTVVGQKTEI